VSEAGVGWPQLATRLLTGAQERKGDSELSFETAERAFHDKTNRVRVIVDRELDTRIDETKVPGQPVQRLPHRVRTHDQIVE